MLYNDDEDRDRTSPTSCTCLCAVVMEKDSSCDESRMTSVSGKSWQVNSSGSLCHPPSTSSIVNEMYISRPSNTETNPCAMEDDNDSYVVLRWMGYSEYP
jgi:hypothetical protein